MRWIQTKLLLAVNFSNYESMYVALWEWNLPAVKQENVGEKIFFISK
jgi:hypothetical protein